MRFIVRPKGILGTPRALAGELNCRLRYYPNPRRANRLYDLRRDFLMTPVNPEHLVAYTEDYIDYHMFMTRNKYGQRRLLEAGGIPIPRTYGAPPEAWGAAFDPGVRYVVRPLRHSGGRGYRVTEDPADFRPGQEYLTEVYPKRREYRVIFVLGQPAVYLRKKPNDGVSEDQPWGHTNSTFQTINDWASCRLSNTDCVARLAAFPVVKGAHIIAADILYNRKHKPQYVICELNNCPALTIDENRARIAEIIRDRSPRTFQYRLQALR